jgi:hypothetical protein
MLLVLLPLVLALLECSDGAFDDGTVLISSCYFIAGLYPKQPIQIVWHIYYWYILAY